MTSWGGNNARFNVIENSDESEKGLVGKVVNFLFRKPINTNPQKSELGGEKILTIQHSDPTYDTSIHLMHFGSIEPNGEEKEATQDKHKHPGPRFLTILAGKPWSLYLGEQMLNIPPEGQLKMIEIHFPADSLTTLEFRKNVLHGFKGINIGAISFHWTDTEEAQEMGVPNEELNNKDIMGKLTKIVDNQSRIVVIENMPYHEALSLQKNALEVT